MGDGITVTVDTTGFTAMISELSRLSGRTFEEVTTVQALLLIKACIRKTPARSVGVITKRVSRKMNYIEFSSGHVVSFWKKANVEMFLDDSNFKPSSPGTKKRNKLPTMVGNKSWHNMDKHHWSDVRWARYQGFQSQTKAISRQRLAEAVAGRGLAKKTWLQMADELGLSVSGVAAYVRSAKAPGGKEYKEGFAKRMIEAAANYIELTNSNPIMRKLNGVRILQSAINARKRAFEYETKKGVFADVALRAKRYPGIFTNP